MLRQLNTKSVVIGSLIAMASIWTFVVVIAVRKTFQNQAAIGASESAISQLRGRIDVMDQKFDLRLEALERFVYGPLTDEAVKPLPRTVRKPKSEDWQKNRDEEILKRLQALEQFRMRAENRPPIR